MTQVLYDYTRADASGASCVAHAWAKVPVPLTSRRRDELKDLIARELKARDAVMVAHYYVDGDLQDLAQQTGGCVADSLEMARFGRDHAARTLVVSGVRFMGETAKILSPHKRVLMPDLDATCSLDLGCPPEDFAKFCDAHPDRQVVVYANTSAAVKARADWMVTSSCAPAIVEHLHRQGQKILWAPDKHLGRYIQQTDRRRHAAVGRRLHRARRVQGPRARAVAQGSSERDGAGASRVARGGGAPGRCRGLDLAADEGRGRRQGAANTSSPPTKACSTACSSWRPARR